MTVSPAQKTAIEEVISAILVVTASRGKRQLAAMFMDLYYEIIPEPRCLKNIQSGVAKGRYRDASDVYTDLSLVFWNALFYNEAGSQIVMDAETLKNVLETEWKKRPVLPNPRSSPPPSSAQKVHGTLVPDNSGDTTPAPPTPAAPTPAALPVPHVPARTIIPSSQSRVPPAASTSTNQTHAKPVPIRPKSAQRMGTPDMDVDVVSPDSDGQDEDAGAFRADRDPQSEEIVKQLEKGLPRWPGFGDEGWMGDVNPERYSDIVHAIKGHKDIIGNRLAVCLESVPEESPATLNLSSTSPISLKQIETRARHKMYKSAKEFDLEFARLFEKARRWHESGSEAYGRTLLLQRLYQALTSPNPPIAPYISSTNFASLRAGPGNVKPVHGSDGEGVPNVTTHRVLTRDRTFVDEVSYKGWKVKLADWVHLSNPDDPSKPIIGQKGQPGITVSWYYRPEQTYHPASRQFWEGEVFKTSHFADHPVEDIIEKIACQFTARHIRGRPRPPFWYVGFPLYVCDARYNDRDRVFVRLKNWNSCVPEEVRQTPEFMPIYPFERTVYPVRLPSPFLLKGPGGKAAVKGPGGIISGGAADQAEAPLDAGDKKRNGGGGGRNDGAAAARNASSAPAAPPYQAAPQSTYIQPYVGGLGRGGLGAIGGPAQVEKLAPETAKLFDRDPDTNEVLWFAAPPLNLPRAKGLRHSLAYLQFLARKRKTPQDGDEGANADGPDPTKRARTAVLPTVTETTMRVLKEMAFDG
ncbi:RSC complex protein [Pholiota molesta]|nr:RSC complex protein [Pholiota molesta]